MNKTFKLSQTNPPTQKPFLKWAGGKYRLLPQMMALLPKGPRLIEPFAGGAALFQNANYPSYLIADSNPDLIGLYQGLKEDPQGLIRQCQELFSGQYNTPERFYQLRTEFNEIGDGDPKRKSALFLYLNRHGYNGLCRYNSSGGFNVPFGKYKMPYFPQKEMVRFAHKAQQTVFMVADFEETLGEARPGDVVYCDPPYVPLSQTANFTQYSKGDFGLKDQERLARVVSELARSGVWVLVSNHDTPFIRQAYMSTPWTREFLELQVARMISCDGANRNKAAEILALLGPC